MRHVESSVDLVQDIHRRAAEGKRRQYAASSTEEGSSHLRLEPEKRHDERQGDQRPLTAGELGQARLPYRAQADFDLQALGDLLALERLQLAKVAWQELGKDVAEFAAKIRVSLDRH